MKNIFFCLFTLTLFASNFSPIDFSENQKIAIQNSILAKVNGNTISVLDIKKKMDIAFHRNYPHLENSLEARCQFYEASWRHVLMEMIDHQLILADATEKNIPLTDGEVREEMENRFGPNIMFTLDKLGLTYDETWKMIKDELTVQRMTWWFIHSKAMNQVTPQDIRQAFRIYIKENPSYQEWKYRVIAIRGDNLDEKAKMIHDRLKANNQSPESAAALLRDIDPTAQVSTEFTATDKQLSDAHRAALAGLSPGEYSKPIMQKSRSDNQVVARIFYLSEKTDHPAPQFEALSHTLRDQLVQKAVSQESIAYLDKLRKQHSYYENAPEDFHPFSLNSVPH